MIERIVVIGRIHALGDYRGELQNLLRNAQLDVRDQAGCLAADFAAALDDPGTYLFVQEWEDQASLDAHYATDAFASFQHALSPMLERPSEVGWHTVTETVRPQDPTPQT
jgi:quinol monooxygenase YgiN